LPLLVVRSGSTSLSQSSHAVNITTREIQHLALVPEESSVSFRMAAFVASVVVASSG
jgi:hypothetical protein